MKCLIPKTANSRPLFPVDAANLPHWLASRDAATRRFLLGCGFDASAGSLCALPGGDGHPSGFAFGFDPQDPWSLAVLPDKLPPGNYHLQGGAIPADSMALAWYLACYRFDRYRQPVKNRAERKPPCLVTERVVRQRVEPIAEAICLTRDLINTPAEDMLPRHLAQVVAKLAADFGGGFSETVGKQLLRSNFPSIHAVGRASADEPRLLDLRWGDARAPRITLVGKGVCFDTGGLDLKPSRFMRMMKKDMGGAAHAIGLARWIMHTRLPVRLRLLIPAVENAVSGNALRPGDVIASRKGLSVEIDNTDAEGRVVLSDALALAAEESPRLILDFATLTGAARVALGTELPALFTDDDQLADELMAAARRVHDPMWRLPMHRPYRRLMDSKIADIANASASSYAGAITAALFLREFVPADVPWAHFDIMAWNVSDQPGRPEGGEAMGLRAVADYLRARFG